MTAGERVFAYPEAGMRAVLEGREMRVKTQHEAFKTGCASVISFTLNVPGPVKQCPLLEEAFKEGEQALTSAFGESLKPFSCFSGITGCEGVYLSDLSPADTKELSVQIEQSHPLGRLFDIDVIGQEGSVSRSGLSLPARKCFLCGGDARVCGRSRAHSVSELQEAVAGILERFFSARYAERFAACAAGAMEEEVSLTPKPGLVDRHDNGAHRDMDYGVFLKSIEALRPHLKRFYLAGRENAGESGEELFLRLRTAGLIAEKDMFAATNGVNTHKGLLFSLALLLGAAGRLQAGTDGRFSVETLLKTAATIGKNALSDFGSALTRPLGARGEAANGFPSVLRAFSVFEEELIAGRSREFAASKTLMMLIASAEDTNVLRRAGQEEAGKRRLEAEELLVSFTEDNYRETLSRLNGSYIKVNISPGGSADLLALALFLDRCKQDSLLAEA